MSSQPPAGQGLLCSISQVPERSGLPSAVRGVGAERSSLPSAVRGTPAVGYFSHWAPKGTASGAEIATAKTATTLFIISPPGALFPHQVLFILFVLTADIVHQLGIKNDEFLQLDRPRLGVRFG